MSEFVPWIVRGMGLGVGLLALDRLLLWMEKQGWIHYRRHGLSRTAPLYHTLEIHSVFDPAMQNTMEVRFAQERQEDDSGAPPGADEDSGASPGGDDDGKADGPSSSD